MSLRKPHGEAWEIPAKPESLMADIKRFHRLKSYGRLFGCTCGKTFETAKSIPVANMYLSMHQTAVKEAMEDSRAGRSNYDSE